MPYQISADTGGTFIDVVVTDPEGHMTIGKSLTTHDRAFVGIERAVTAAADELGTTAQDLLTQTDLFIYGTTRATNAIVTRNAAKTALLVTEGFPEILVLKEAGKEDAHDFSTGARPPYIPKRHTFEVRERISSEGLVTTELDEASVRDVLKQLRNEEFEAIAVCLLWSIVNPEHEKRVGALIAEILPGVPYTLSHELAPVAREYRRASASAIDASLKPLMQAHLRELQEDLRAFGYKGQLLVSTSAGGVMAIEEVAGTPINMAKSGPSMAPVAALSYSAHEGLGTDILVCDTGGTTFDVALTRNGQLVYTRDTWLGGMWEGDLLGISSVDIRSVGSGGGSIAWVDSGGLLRVGPQSAGSEPGPACYGRGGVLPTVTDAACVLGYLDPEFFLGGRMSLDPEAAQRVIAEIADPLGISVEKAAEGIWTIATDAMVKAVQEITIAQGLNPQECTLVAGGGAAGLNIMQVAKELGSKKALLPRMASALSASGMHFADIIKEESQAHLTLTSSFDRDGVNNILSQLETKLSAFTSKMEMENEVSIELIAEARYSGQVWDVDTRLPVDRFDSQDDVDAFVAEFHKAHFDVYAIKDEGSTIEISNWRARLTAKMLKPEIRGNLESHVQTEPRRRDCYFGGDFHSTAIYRPENILAGQIIEGPAIIEEPTTTLVVMPEMAVEVSKSGNYVLHIEGA